MHAADMEDIDKAYAGTVDRGIIDLLKKNIECTIATNMVRTNWWILGIYNADEV